MWLLSSMAFLSQSLARRTCQSWDCLGLYNYNSQVLIEGVKVSMS